MHCKDESSVAILSVPYADSVRDFRRQDTPWVTWYRAGHNQDPHGYPISGKPMTLSCFRYSSLMMKLSYFITSSHFIPITRKAPTLQQGRMARQKPLHWEQNILHANDSELLSTPPNGLSHQSSSPTHLATGYTRLYSLTTSKLGFSTSRPVNILDGPSWHPQLLSFAPQGQNQWTVSHCLPCSYISMCWLGDHNEKQPVLRFVSEPFHDAIRSILG
jgi:hypothetical protein